MTTRALQLTIGACFLAALSVASTASRAQSLIGDGPTEPTAPAYETGAPPAWHGRLEHVPGRGHLGRGHHRY